MSIDICPECGQKYDSAEVYVGPTYAELAAAVVEWGEAKRAFIPLEHGLVGTADEWRTAHDRFTKSEDNLNILAARLREREGK